MPPMYGLTMHSCSFKGMSLDRETERQREGFERRAEKIFVPLSMG